MHLNMKPIQNNRLLKRVYLTSLTVIASVIFTACTIKNTVSPEKLNANTSKQIESDASKTPILDGASILGNLIGTDWIPILNSPTTAIGGILPDDSYNNTYKVVKFLFKTDKQLLELNLRRNHITTQGKVKQYFLLKIYDNVPSVTAKLDDTYIYGNFDCKGYIELYNTDITISEGDSNSLNWTKVDDKYQINVKLTTRDYYDLVSALLE